MPLYAFVRQDMFYPIELRDDADARANAECNPGTIRVENIATGDGVWPVPDFKKCGGGKGPECCTFMTVGAKGFCCERRGPLHDTLAERTKRPDWSSKRAPEEPYPACQIAAEQ